MLAGEVNVPHRPMNQPARYIVVVLVLMAIAPNPGIAKGCYVRPPPPHVIAVAHVPNSMSDSFAHKLLGQCGDHRYRDALAQKCRGPGNL
jgi:hypothetical protein